MSDETPPSVDEFVDYCRMQAGLLSGRVETMAADADELLDEIDEEVATLRARLEERRNVAGTETPSSTDRPGTEEFDVESLEELQRDLEEKQLLVEAKGARMEAFQELAAGYTELAGDLEGTDEASDALDRIVEFELENDAPAYFDERETLCEAAAEQAETTTDAELVEDVEPTDGAQAADEAEFGESEDG
ncbi:hypothetical protein [Natrarchaeobius oligotrophus]|uniref:Uncharacterized protein n=1 Tax=Natrarchaeobius chitinivorans TaxID=1679083 RepID=A0A3N6MG28_NATCH|nr:hypothetical protein [Natrarchaeobius chitinivorans]RQH01928.1 hypothetical protein EA472_06380 [Natrarchaeobius chitinivorans]